MRARKKLGTGKNGMSLPTMVVVTIFMAILAISFLYPLFYMIVNSFKDTLEYYINPFALPKTFNLENYTVMLGEFKILRYLKNSLILSISSTLIIVMGSIFASYAFAKLRFVGKEIVYIIILITMFLPGQATIIPQYVMFSRYHLTNNYWSVILSYVASGFPGAILLLRSSFMGIPDELLESAKIDGAGYFVTVFKIAVPVTMAAIAIQIIFSFIGYWNDLLTPMLLLSKAEKQTVMVALSSLFSRYGSAPTRQLTGLFISVFPTLFMYLFLQKYMMKGMLAGSIKA